MNKRYFLIFLLIFSTTFISASCSEGQIDINSASAEELDKLYNIGPAKADAIINSRPFDSVDNLINISGIGEKTLEGIKNQGLACVGKSDDNKKETEIVEEPEKEIQEIKIIQAEVIKLNPDTKSIKTKNIKEWDSKKLAIYGLVSFCILLIALLIFRKNGFNKNEFK